MVDKIKLVVGEKKFYGLLHQYHNKAMKEKGIDPAVVEKKKKENDKAKAEAAVAKAAAPKIPPSNPYAKPMNNPYAKKPPANPYASSSKSTVSNPYGKSSAGGSANPYAKAGVTSSGGGVKPKQTNNDLWVDRYKPTSTREILGNKTNINKLENWLKSWEKIFLNPKATGKTFSNPKGPWKAALLSGPPGIGSKFLRNFFFVAFTMCPVLPLPLSMTHRNYYSYFGFPGGW